MRTTRVVSDRVDVDPGGPDLWHAFVDAVERDSVVLAGVRVWETLVLELAEEAPRQEVYPIADEGAPLLLATVSLVYGAFQFVDRVGEATGSVTADPGDRLALLRRVLGELAVEGMIEVGGRVSSVRLSAERLVIRFSSGFELAVVPVVPEDAWRISVEEWPR